MAHKTLVNGTAYNITGGKSMVSGTTYSIKGGKTLVGGTGYNISFGGGEPAYAMLYSDGKMVFQLEDAVESGKTLTASYTGFEDANYTYMKGVPWHSQRNKIRNVHCKSTDITPVSLVYWFDNCTSMNNFDFVNFNMDNVVNMHHAFCNCYKLAMSPVCGNNVTHMADAYDNCTRLSGSPVCGRNVINMSSAYSKCSLLTGLPVCGNNVKDVSYAYSHCNSIGKNGYFYSSVVNNARYCFGAKNNSRRLNLYVPANSTTNTTVHYNNVYSLVGANIAWTTNSTCSYNTKYNIYIYPVANVAAAAIANGDEEANANAGVIIGGSNEGDAGSPANYTVESVSGASYGFSLNGNGYYESRNKGVASSAAVCKVNIVADGRSEIIFDCINYGESNCDYGLLSTIDKTLTTSSTADTSNVFKNFKGLQQSTVQSVSYGVLSAGTHYVYVKYIKDGSVDNNNDSLQFKVRAV